MGEKWTEMLFMKMVSVQKKRIGSLCRGGVALPRLIFVFFVGDMSPSSMPPSKSKPSTPSGDGPIHIY